jgi:prophage DNA circulation protein
LPQQDFPIVQDQGRSATHLAIEASFQGADYDQTADAFYEALHEGGPGTLLHPRWGDLSVMPISITQREGFAEGMRQATFEIDFVQVSALAVPSTAAQAESVIAADAEAADQAIIDAFLIEPADAADSANTEARSRGGIARFADKIRGVIDSAEEVRDRFDELVRGFETSAFSPATIASDTVEIMRAPAQASVSIIGKLRAYGGVVAELSAQLPEAGASPAEAATQIVQFLGCLLGFSESVLAGTMATRAEAVEAAELAQDTLYAAMEAIEQAEAASGYLSPEEILAALKALMAQTAGLLLERSFSLAIEQRLVLDADRTPLDLIYELAAPESVEELEAALDVFITHNRLTGDELLLIPRGREVVYYAA